MADSRLTQAVARFGANLVHEFGPDDVPEFDSAAIDSRAVAPGDLFVALPGRRVDGHHFLSSAVKNGARGLLISSARFGEPAIAAGVRRASGTARVLVVDDVLPAFQSLAADYLDRCTSAVRIGITGSNGKTSTKEMLASVLERCAPTFRSHGNLNSEIGVPLSAFAVSPDDRYAVFELAMDRPGEMERLAAIVRPTHALITNTADAHTEFVGGRAGVAREKRAIFSQLDSTGHAYIPADDEYRDLLAEPLVAPGTRCTVHYFGINASENFEAYTPRGAEGGTLHYRGREIRIALPGAFVVQNALAAISVAETLGVGLDEIAVGLEAVRPLIGRGRLYRSRVTVLSDFYNANPQSMNGAIETAVAASRDNRRLVLILGAMKELARSDEEHHALGVRLAELGNQLSGQPAAILIGAEMRSAFAAARGEGFGGELSWYPDVQSAAAGVKAVVRSGDFVLLKGSRSIELERLLPLLGVQGEGDVHVS